jgi:hypothetical protein
MRFRRATLASAALVGITAAAAVVCAAPPWAERTVTTHVEFADLHGVLPADRLEALIEAGRNLFTARFTIEDGAGRPMATQAIIPTKRRRPVDFTFMRTAGLDANSCSGCHVDPAPGGSGDFALNVFVSEGFESPNFDVLDPSFSSERGTNHLFGAGLIELLGREMTADLRAQRDQGLAEARANGQPVVVDLVTKGVGFGRIVADPTGLVDFSGLEGVDSDLTVRPFSQKGVFASIRQFSINAMNTHHGMQASERFGMRWTGEADFDEDGYGDELSPGDISALVAFQATLPAPVRSVPDDPAWQTAAAEGERVFADLQCGSCHIPALPLSSLAFSDPAPFDMAGTLRSGEVGEPAVYDLAFLEWTATLPRDAEGNILVPLFGDLRRHRIADAQVNRLGNELLAQRFVEADVFITAELWGLGSTAPYGHRNDITTIDEVIRAHGGEARAARDRYVSATDEQRSALIAFLKTLVIEP